MPRKSRLAVGHESVEVEITIPVRQNGRVKDMGKVPPKAEPPWAPRIPRVARLMALAIKLQDMVDRGEVRDYADLARLGYVTRARMTQIMNLLLLAPDIQEALLLQSSQLPEIREQRLRAIAQIPCWKQQIHSFEVLFGELAKRDIEHAGSPTPLPYGTGGHGSFSKEARNE